MPSLLPRSAPRWLTEPVVGVLARLGVTPNMLTAAGVLGNVGAAVLAARGDFLPAGIVVLAASSLDLFDGALARATGQATDFGSVFDAVMDRVSEAAVLFGLLVYFSDRGGRTEELLAFAAVVGSLLVSYVRARAQIIGLTLREGLFTRAERVAVLAIGLIIDQVTPMLWVLAVLAGATAVQRLFLVWLATARKKE
ncbi:MAG TPA: CDP-alcohol phosphatidyltransferase family protein [Dehalococcoidia bacterium]|nr:CDP-alcohol phosphatidyltransferase family protein [Dehalococcoidia bacterium]